MKKFSIVLKKKKSKKFILDFIKILKLKQLNYKISKFIYKMLGKRKKIHKEDVPLLKKQWEMEFAEEEIKLEKENLEDLKVLPLEDSEPEKIENKQYSEDEHQGTNIKIHYLFLIILLFR